MGINIGLKIKEINELRGISKTELGRRLNMSSTNIHKIFKRESIDTELLSRISDILDYDFFQYYTKPPNTQIANHNNNSKIIQTINETELENCKEKLKMYEKINSLLEEKIRFLEK